VQLITTHSCSIYQHRAYVNQTFRLACMRRDVCHLHASVQLSSSITDHTRPHYSSERRHGRPHIGAMGSADPPGKMDKKLKLKTCKKRAIRAGRCRERRYADHIFIQIYFRMHHFVVKLSKFCSPQAARGIDHPSQNHADALERR